MIISAGDDRDGTFSLAVSWSFGAVATLSCLLHEGE